MPDPFTTTATLGFAPDGYGGAELVTVAAEFDGRRLSITGNGGQNIESVERVANPATAHARAGIARIWRRWHLNDLRPGCPHQERGYQLAPELRPTAARYREAGTCAVCGYSYGHAWNYEPVPVAVLDELRTLLAHADTNQPPYLNEPEEDEEPDEFPHADRIDSRELIGRTFGPDIDAEITDAENYAADWNYGATLIRADDFESYAREYAEGVGAIDDDARWPACHIDWKAAAAALAADFSTVTIDGVDYRVRS